ncbi:Crp/Fnr family transcriptional regulator [Arcticibacter sp. MXS-1]|uniref:Crp/Fnr family transcriptional regulator n=1 Tax=Arcticibacter sp. MXS-1 TaxID=3341726 RepID=UPI0035A8D173
MSAENEIINYVRKFVPLSDEEALELQSAFKRVAIRKRQFVVQPGFPVPYRYYVVDGSLRAYVVNEEGQEHTISFAVEDWWITDYNGYIYQQNATMFVVALEDSVALRLEFSKEQELKARNPKFETFFRIIAERGLAYQQRRVINNLTLSAEQRYQDFLDKYPLIARRLPQYALASFLGMTTEYLSRLRRRASRKS